MRPAVMNSLWSHSSVMAAASGSELCASSARGVALPCRHAGRVATWTQLKVGWASLIRVIADSRMGSLWSQQASRGASCI